jgi:flagellar protein FliO/FliZ
MTLALAAVLAAVFAAAWVMRRLRGFGQRNAQVIQVVADVSLGGKERAVLLQIGTTKLLVGVAPGQVNTLHVLGQEDVVAGSESAVRSLQTPAGSFDSSQGESGANSPTNSDLSASFKAILKRSLGIQQ